MSAPVFTVFTPTFNRADLLMRAYESLNNQTFKGFEWIVVDDGSSDNTRSIIEELQQEARFPVLYHYQENSGKHVAINRGVEMARGFFFLILDSDDWLAVNALERLYAHWQQIQADRREQFAGIATLYAYRDGQVVGTRFPRDRLVSDQIEVRTRYKVKGDNFGTNITHIMREFPFPEGVGRFVTEALVWNRMAQHYKILFINEILAYKEYQQGGLTDRVVFTWSSNPTIARVFFQERMRIKQPVSFRFAIKTYASYVRFALHEGLGLKHQVLCAKQYGWLAVSYPLGGLLWLADKRKLKQGRANTGSYY